MGSLDEKLAWLDDFNKNIIDYDKVRLSSRIIKIGYWKTNRGLTAENTQFDIN